MKNTEITRLEILIECGSFLLLQDLDDTVQIVEKNPAKFRIDSAELSVRKAFIQQTRDEVNRMKEWAENPEKSKTYEVRHLCHYFSKIFFQLDAELLNQRKFFGLIRHTIC